MQLHKRNVCIKMMLRAGYDSTGSGFCVRSSQAGDAPDVYRLRTGSGGLGAVMRPCLAGKGLMQKSKSEIGTVVGETGIRTRYRG